MPDDPSPGRPGRYVVTPNPSPERVPSRYVVTLSPAATGRLSRYCENYNVKPSEAFERLLSTTIGRARVPETSPHPEHDEPLGRLAVADAEGIVQAVYGFFFPGGGCWFEAGSWSRKLSQPELLPLIGSELVRGSRWMSRFF